MISRRSLLLAGAAIPTAAYGQCVTDKFVVDACLGGVRNAGPAGMTLDLNFMFPGTLDPRITFTRASPASYQDASGLIQTAAINQPRWDYAGGSLRGLLIEEARTNLLLWSQDITQSNWQKSGTVTVTGNVVAPDGTNTGQTINVGVPGAGAFFQAVLGLTNGTRYEPSFWINRISTTGTLRVENEINGANGAWLVNIALVGNGWQRITRNHPAVTITTEWTATSGQAGPFVAAQSGTINASWWGFQLEQGGSSLSYIPTTTVAVTKAADVASMPTAAWFNASAGSVSVEFLTPNMPTPGTHSGILRMGDGTSTNASDMYLQLNTGNELFDTTVGGVAQISSGIGIFAANGTEQRVAVGYGGGPWRFSFNGTVTAGTGSAAPFPANTFYFGSINPPASWKLNGYLRRVQYWPRALSNTEMQQVTT